MSVANWSVFLDAPPFHRRGRASRHSHCRRSDFLNASSRKSSLEGAVMAFLRGRLTIPPSILARANEVID